MSYNPSYDIEPMYIDFDFEALAQEYLNKTKELFNENVKDYLDFVKNEKERLKKDREELFERTKLLDEREKNLKKERKDIDEHKNIVIQEMFSQFGLDLKPNQHVYIIKKNTRTEDCPYCKYGEIVKIIDNQEYKAKCPHCNGTGHKYSYTYKIVEGDVCELKIGLVWNTKKQFLYPKRNYDYEYQSPYYTEYELFVCVENIIPYGTFIDNYVYIGIEEVYRTKEEAETAMQKLIDKDKKEMENKDE